MRRPSAVSLRGRRRAEAARIGPDRGVLEPPCTPRRHPSVRSATRLLPHASPSAPHTSSCWIPCGTDSTPAAAAARAAAAAAMARASARTASPAKRNARPRRSARSASRERSANASRVVFKSSAYRLEVRLVPGQGLQIQTDQDVLALREAQQVHAQQGAIPEVRRARRGGIRLRRARRGVHDGVEDLLLRAFVDVREPHAPRKGLDVHPALDAGQPAPLGRARARTQVGVERRRRQRADGLVQPVEQPAHVIGPGDARGVVREGLERHGRGGGTSLHVRGCARALVVALGGGLACGAREGPARPRRTRGGLGARASKRHGEETRARASGFGTRGRAASRLARADACRQASPARSERREARAHGHLGRSLRGGVGPAAPGKGMPSARQTSEIVTRKIDRNCVTRSETNIMTSSEGTDSALLATDDGDEDPHARCKTMPKNQENFPHGSSWCTKCCPVTDSDSGLAS